VRDLVERAAQGDEAAFAALVGAHSNRMFGIARRVLRDQHLAEDALQAALVTIWNELPRLRDPDRFEAWTYRLIVRASIAEARRARRGGATRLLAGDADASTAPDEYGLVALRDSIERGFAHLTPDQRAILVLQYFAGLSLAEIAETLGIPVGTAGSRVHYATRALRAAMEADSRTAGSLERSA
jgi:RNA polymerase sigma-70 factor (ECF subfamily)